MATITCVQSVSGVTGGSTGNTTVSVTVTKPVSGNLLVIGFQNDTNSTPTYPAGFSHVTNSPQNANGATTALLYKIAGSSESTSYTITWTGTTGAAMWFAEYNAAGGWNGTPLDQATVSESAASWTTNALSAGTSTNPNDLVVCFATVDDIAHAYTFTATSMALSQRLAPTQSGTNSLQDVTIWAADASIATTQSIATTVTINTTSVDASYAGIAAFKANPDPPFVPPPIPADLILRQYGLEAVYQNNVPSPATSPVSPQQIQEIPFINGNNTDTTNVLNCNTQQGSVLVMSVALRKSSGNPTVTSITDNAGNVWQRASNASPGILNTGASQIDLELWYCTNASPVSAITVNHGAASLAASLQEFAVPWPTTAVLDQNVYGAQTSNTTVNSGNTGPTSVAGELAVGFSGWNGKPTISGQTAGWTYNAAHRGGPSGSNDNIQTAWQVATNVSSILTIGELLSVASATGAGIVTFGPGPLPAPPAPPPIPADLILRQYGLEAVYYAPVASPAVAGAVSLTGSPFTFTFTTPAGTQTNDVVLTGSPFTFNFTTPTGTVAAGVSLTGSPFTFNFTTPAGTQTNDVVLTGSPFTFNFTTPAGTVTVGVSLTGSPFTFTFTTPAGTVTATSGGTAVTLTGSPFTVTFTTFAGTVIAAGIVYNYFRTPAISDDSPYRADKMYDVDYRLRRFYKPLQSGINVILYWDGTVSPVYVPGQPVQYPTQQWDPLFGSGETAVNVRTSSNGTIISEVTTPKIRRIFYGGHAEPVSPAEQALLEAAGYGPFITPT